MTVGSAELVDEGSHKSTTKAPTAMKRSVSFTFPPRTQHAPLKGARRYPQRGIVCLLGSCDD